MLSPLDVTAVLNINKTLSLKSISAVNISAVSVDLDSVSLLNVGNIAQFRQHLNCSCALAGVRMTTLVYSLTSLHMVHKDTRAATHVSVYTNDCTSIASVGSHACGRTCTWRHMYGSSTPERYIP
jgi:hypothetical protein